MKITFFSNFLNPHQIEFCKEMINQPGVDFTFVATEPFNKEAVTKGFDDINLKYSFCLPVYLNEKNNQKAIQLCTDSDIVIIGSASEFFFRKRIRSGKVTFRYSERAFKPKYNKKYNPITLLCMIKGNTIYNSKPLYMLCASAYTAPDYKLVGAYKNKAFKWGYFPLGSTKTFEELYKIKEENTTIQILWAGRFIDWKSPKLAIETAKYLIDNGINFKLCMYGDGEEKDNLVQLVNKYNLHNCVAINASLSNADIINEMEKSHIFLATSDYNEGWGAVVNEAMTASCAVIASSAMGSVPFLIKNGFNGTTFSIKNKVNSALYKYRCSNLLIICVGAQSKISKLRGV